MDIYSKLMIQLDCDQPDWFIAWATQIELRDYAHYTHMKEDTRRERLRRQVCDRMFHRILHAALTAGIVTEVVE